MDQLTTETVLDVPPARATRVRYQVLAVACSVAVVTYIHRVGFTTASTEIKSDLQLTTPELGYLMTAFLLAYGVFEVPGGLLADRFGVRNLLTILVLGWSLMTGMITVVTVIPAVAVAFSVLLVLRFLFGMFQAGGFPSLSRMMTDWMTRQERASAQGLIWMSSRVGGALAPLLLGGLFGGVDRDGPGRSLVRALLALVSQSARGDEPSERLGKRNHRLGKRPDFSRPPGLEHALPLAERLGFMPDVRFRRFLRDFLHYHAARLLAKPPRIDTAPNALAHESTPGLWRCGLRHGRIPVGLVYPANRGSQMGPTPERSGGFDDGGVGHLLDHLGAKCISFRRTSVLYVFLQ